MKLEKVLQGYLFDIQTEYSWHTVRLYRVLLPKLCDFLGNPEIDGVTTHDLQRFIQYMQNKGLSPSSVDNYWKGIRSLFGWASDTLGTKRPDLKLSRPVFKLPEVVPFTQDEIKRLLKGCETTAAARTTRRKEFTMRRPTVNRDKALILVLLDTGLRIGELCRLKIEDVNLDTGEVLVAPYSTAKKTRPRIVYLGKAARRQLWLYLAKDREDPEPDDLLFDTNERTIRSMLRRLGEKTNVHKTYPHRFRHTMAIMSLRNGMNIYELQRLLGHSDLDMVKHYLSLADTDVEAAHRKASPVDKWKL